MRYKNELKIILLNSNNEIEKTEAEEKLKETEKCLTEKFSAKFAEIIKEQTKQIGTLEGKFSQVGFWKIKKKLCPQGADPPMAKLNEKGLLITSPNLLKDLYLRTYKHRLRQREMKEEYMDIFFLKNELWESRMKELIGIKSEEWSLADLMKIL